MIKFIALRLVILITMLIGVIIIVSNLKNEYHNNNNQQIVDIKRENDLLDTCSRICENGDTKKCSDCIDFLYEAGEMK